MTKLSKFSSRVIRSEARKWILIGIGAGALCGSRAAEYLPWERGSVSVGGLVSVFESDLTFGLNSGPGVELNGEDVLGMDDTLAVVRAEVMFRPDQNRRHQLDFSYAGFHRDGEATLSRTLTIGSITYPVGANLNSVFNFDIYRFSYSYAFLQKERTRVAVGVGLYVMPVEYGLEINTGGGRSIVEGGDTTLPLPALTIQAEFQLFPKVFLNARVSGMYLETDDFKGGLLEAGLAVEYRPWKHFGLGFGYGGLLAEVESSSTNSDFPGAEKVGSVHVQYNGLMLYGKYSF